MSSYEESKELLAQASYENALDKMAQEEFADDALAVYISDTDFLDYLDEKVDAGIREAANSDVDYLAVLFAYGYGELEQIDSLISSTKTSEQLLAYVILENTEPAELEGDQDKVCEVLASAYAEHLKSLDWDVELYVDWNSGKLRLDDGLFWAPGVLLCLK